MHYAVESHASSAQGSSGCPVLNSAQEALNPDNMMPMPNQKRAPGQAVLLSTERVSSTIPQGDGKETWTYPSEQMFYNALLRKGKGEGVKEETMGAVVAIHNNMNERAWKQVLEWEALHCEECEKPTLRRFVGRPDELSPKARLKYMLGLVSKPFDRHDWTVDRCGKEVRYILDYYDVAEKRAEDKVPQLHDLSSVPSIEIDVRPALDSPTAVVDRLTMMGRYAASSLLSSLSVAAAKETVVTDLGSSGGAGGSMDGRGEDALSQPMVLNDADRVRQRCQEYFDALADCGDEREQAQAHIGLTLCIAREVCPQEAADFVALKGRADPDIASATFSQMEECTARWAERAQNGGSA